MVSSI
jgi:hypothetical protein